MSPDTAGSGEIKFDCKTAICPEDCDGGKFLFWDTSNPGYKHFTLDDSISLACAPGNYLNAFIC